MQPDWSNPICREIDCISGDWSETGTWSVNDDVLILEYTEGGGGKEIYTILSLTKPKMILRLDEAWEAGRHGFFNGIEEWTRVE